MATAVQSKSSAKISVVASLTVVLVCLALGGGFVWWYLRTVTDTRTIKLSADELATLQTASHQMTFKSSGGVGGGFNRPRPAVRLINRAATDPDGIFPAGNWHVIKAGQVQARVQPGAKPTDPPIILFRQRTWGQLQDAPIFTIGRRIAREPALAKQMAVSPDQLTQLTALATSPAVHGDYLTALPVNTDDMDAVRKAWIAYQAAVHANQPNSLPPAQAALLKTVREVGTRAMDKARQDYAEAAKKIGNILEPRQIEAYHSGKTLPPLK